MEESSSGRWDGMGWDGMETAEMGWEGLERGWDGREGLTDDMMRWDRNEMG